MILHELVTSGAIVEGRRLDRVRSWRQGEERGPSLVKDTKDVPGDETKQTGPVDLLQAIDPLRKALETLNRDVSIQYRSDMEALVIVVSHLDPETGQPTKEVVRQIPPEEALRMAQRLKDNRAALLDEIA
jgi:uncharacterized FlaG/YvyC family protein